MADGNLHAGHRERMREKFIKGGCRATMPEHELLEMLLFYAIPRKNTNEIAHRLLREFGSFKGVCNADIEDLKRIEGISVSSATLIKLVGAGASAYCTKALPKGMNFARVDSVGEFLQDMYKGLCEEQFSILSLDGAGNLLSFDVLSVGDLAMVSVSIRNVVKIMLRTRATAVILAHNHPSGIALPSLADLKVTKSIKSALHPVGIQLLDHFILTDSDYVSLAQSEKFSYIFEDEKESEAL